MAQSATNALEARLHIAVRQLCNVTSKDFFVLNWILRAFEKC